MPRYPRKMSDSNTYHVMIRGNEKRKIFFDDEDRHQFLDTMGRMNVDNNYYLYAYCLMENHVHLLIKEGNDSISKIMKRISVSYVSYFNKKYTRVGHLFQDRFRSEIIEDDTYLLMAARYIHNNPVKAGMVNKASEYGWNSYKAYLDREHKVPELINADIILGIFSEDMKIAIKRFMQFTKEVEEDKFIDLDYNIVKQSDFINEADVTNLIAKILIKYGKTIDSFKQCKNKKERDTLIKEIKENNSIPLRRLSNILGLSKDIIFRA